MPQTKPFINILLLIEVHSRVKGTSQRENIEILLKRRNYDNYPPPLVSLLFVLQSGVAALLMSGSRAAAICVHRWLAFMGTLQLDAPLHTADKPRAGFTSNTLSSLHPAHPTLNATKNMVVCFFVFLCVYQFWGKNVCFFHFFWYFIFFSWIFFVVLVEIVLSLKKSSFSLIIPREKIFCHSAFFWAKMALFCKMRFFLYHNLKSLLRPLQVGGKMGLCSFWSISSKITVMSPLEVAREQLASAEAMYEMTLHFRAVLNPKLREQLWAFSHHPKHADVVRDVLRLGSSPVRCYHKQLIQPEKLEECQQISPIIILSFLQWCFDGWCSSWRHYLLWVGIFDWLCM